MAEARRAALDAEAVKARAHTRLASIASKLLSEARRTAAKLTQAEKDRLCAEKDRLCAEKDRLRAVERLGVFENDSKRQLAAAQAEAFAEKDRVASACFAGLEEIERLVAERVKDARAASAAMAVMAGSSPLLTHASVRVAAAREAVSARIADLKSQVSKKDTIIAEKDTIITEKDQAIAEKNQAIADKEAALRAEVERHRRSQDRFTEAFGREKRARKAAATDAVSVRVGLPKCIPRCPA